MRAIKSFVKKRAPRKRGVLICQALFTVPMALMILVCGILEVGDLEARVAATYQGAEDKACWFHVYPYSQKDKELKFEVATATEHHTDVDYDTVLFHAASSVSFGGGATIASLHPEQCALAFNISGTSTTVYNNESQPMAALAFEHCEAGPGPISFQQRDVDRDSYLATAIVSLICWSILRLLLISRSFAKQGVDARHPPSTAVRNRGLRVPPPFSSMLERFTGGDRLLPKNIYLTILRPYVLYSVSSASLLQPFTRIRMHDVCPQVVLQSGNSDVILATTILGCIVVVALLLNWTIDTAVAWLRWMIGDMKREADMEQEYPFKAQGRATDVLMVCIIIRAVVATIVDWPFYFEVRLLFSINFPEYSISRWSHILRLSAFSLWLVDTTSSLAKFVATDPANRYANLLAKGVLPVLGWGDVDYGKLADLRGVQVKQVVSGTDHRLTLTRSEFFGRLGP